MAYKNELLDILVEILNCSELCKLFQDGLLICKLVKYVYIFRSKISQYTFMIRFSLLNSF